MSKRILSIALAVVMLFSVCAIAVSAADLSSGQYGFALYTDALIGMPVGSTVTVTCAYQYPAGYDVTSEKQTAGNTVLCWNNTVFDYQGYEWLVTNSSGDVFFKYSEPTMTPALYTTLSSKFTATDTAKAEKSGWNQLGLFQQAYDTTAQNEYTNLTGYTATLDSNNEMKYLTVTFTTLKVLTADDIIAISEASVTSMKNTNIKVRQGTKNVTIAPENTVITDASVAPVKAIIKAAKDGEAVKTLAGWGIYNAAEDVPCSYKHLNGDSKAVWCLAVKATFAAADIDPEGKLFAEGSKVSNKIDSLNATVKIGATTLDGNTKFIYDNGDGTYSYYVVLQNLPEGVTDTATITFGGTLVGGGAIKGETVTVDLAAAFAAAQGRGMPETAPDAPAGHSAEA